MEGNFDPIVQKFLNKLQRLNLPSVPNISPQEARKTLNRLQSEVREWPILEEFSEEWTQTGPLFNVISVRPSARGKAILPAVLYMHGGGWVLGDYQTHRNLVAKICLQNEVCVIFVEYTPSPEARFPMALEQAAKVLNEISQQGNRFNVDPKNIFVAGDSVGGNMSAVLAIENYSKIRGQILLYPLLNYDFYNASCTQFANGPWLTIKAVPWYWEQYEPNLSKRTDRLHSPLRTPDDLLRNLPATLIVVDENDVLRDEGEAYAHKLMRLNIDLTSFRALGTIHDFMMLDDLAESPATLNTLVLIQAFLEKNIA